MRTLVKAVPYTSAYVDQGRPDTTYRFAGGRKHIVCLRQRVNTVRKRLAVLIQQQNKADLWPRASRFMDTPVDCSSQAQIVRIRDDSRPFPPCGQSVQGVEGISTGSVVDQHYGSFVRKDFYFAGEHLKIGAIRYDYTGKYTQLAVASALRW